MSQENVEIVLGLYPPPGADFVQLFGDDSLWAAQAEAMAPFIHDDFECAQHEFGGVKGYVGLDGLRAFLLDWMAPWATYVVELEEAIDLDDRVLLLNRDRGCREGSTHEIRGRLGALWTLRGGKLARLDAYTDRSEALKAVGLEE
jgi:ketosteroid isomerase-like protein